MPGIRFKSAILAAVLAVAVLAACGGGGGAAGPPERSVEFDGTVVTADGAEYPVVVTSEPGAQAREYRACVSSPGDRERCVGPTEGGHGAAAAALRADQAGAGIVVFGLVGGDTADVAGVDATLGDPVGGAVRVLLATADSDPVCLTLVDAAGAVPVGVGVTGEASRQDASRCAPEPAAAAVTLHPVVVAADEQSAIAQRERLDLIVTGAAQFWRDQGLDVAVEPAQALVDPERADVLVGLPGAGEPCAVTEQLAVPAGGPGDVAVVLGGVIRSTVTFERRLGVACGGWAEACPPHGSAAGAVLLDGTADGPVSTELVLAHELGHVFGLRHAGEPGCGGVEIPSVEGSSNLMAVEEALASGATPTLDAVELEPVQIASAAAFAG